MLPFLCGSRDRVEVRRDSQMGKSSCVVEKKGPSPKTYAEDETRSRLKYDVVGMR